MIYSRTDLYEIGFDELPDCNLEDLIYLELSACTFGYASNTRFAFWIKYTRSYANWNFERPPLAQYYDTVRSALRKVVPSEPFEPAPKMKSWQAEDGYYKLPIDYLAPNINTLTKYVHPIEDRVCSREELEAIYGGPLDDIPQKIKDYLEKHIAFYINKSWGEQDFDAYYDKFMDRWRVNRNLLNPLIQKHFNFTQYTPRLCHPVSDRYPILPRRDF